MNMLTSSLQFCLVVSLVTLATDSAGKLSEVNVIVPDNQVQPNVRDTAFLSQNVAASSRVRRQDSSSTTTPKPKKHRPSNIFNLISVLVSETREDANRAFNEIGTLFNSQFVNGTTTTTTTTTTMSPSNETTTTDDDEDVTSTTEPFRITRNEFFGVLRSNVQGLVQLFGKEFRMALQDSSKNVKEFGRDFKNAVWPYFSRTTTAAPKESRR